MVAILHMMKISSRKVDLTSAQMLDAQWESLTEMVVLILLPSASSCTMQSLVDNGNHWKLLIKDMARLVRIMLQKDYSNNKQ